MFNQNYYVKRRPVFICLQFRWKFLRFKWFEWNLKNVWIAKFAYTNCKQLKTDYECKCLSTFGDTQSNYVRMIWVALMSLTKDPMKGAFSNVIRSPSQKEKTNRNEENGNKLQSFTAVNSHSEITSKSIFEIPSHAPRLCLSSLNWVCESCSILRRIRGIYDVVIVTDCDYFFLYFFHFTTANDTIILCTLIRTRRGSAAYRWYLLPAIIMLYNIWVRSLKSL